MTCSLTYETVISTGILFKLAVHGAASRRLSYAVLWFPRVSCVCERNIYLAEHLVSVSEANQSLHLVGACCVSSFLFRRAHD